MKRFHVHIRVENLAQSMAFYERLFASPPTRVESDYAKWMLEDPRVNFAISTRGGAAGLDHLGFQTDTSEELTQLKTQAQSADAAFVDEGATSCCYAQSEKHWITDPQGIAWEHFHTLGNIPVFNEAPANAAKEASEKSRACCAPSSASASSSKKSCC
jgi:lactoylglutathione lyase